MLNHKINNSFLQLQLHTTTKSTIPFSNTNLNAKMNIRTAVSDKYDFILHSLAPFICNWYRQHLVLCGYLWHAGTATLGFEVAQEFGWAVGLNHCCALL